MVAQHDTVGTNSPLVIFSEVGDDDLHSGIFFVKVSCNLITLALVVDCDSTDDNGGCWLDSVGQVFGLREKYA